MLLLSHKATGFYSVGKNQRQSERKERERWRQRERVGGVGGSEREDSQRMRRPLDVCLSLLPPLLNGAPACLMQRGIV